MSQKRITPVLLTSLVLFGALILSACSSSSQLTTKSVNDKVGDLFTLTAQSPIEGTATVKAAFQQAVQATKSSKIRMTLTKTLVYPKLLSISYPGDWRENSVGTKGLNAGSDLGFISVIGRNDDDMSLATIGSEPSVYLRNMCASKDDQHACFPADKLEPIAIDGLAGARLETEIVTGYRAYGGRAIFVLVYVPKANSYALIMLGTFDKSRWDEFKPIAESMLTTIKWEN